MLDSSSTELAKVFVQIDDAIAARFGDEYRYPACIPTESQKGMWGQLKNWQGAIADILNHEISNDFALQLVRKRRLHLEIAADYDSVEEMESDLEIARLLLADSLNKTLKMGGDRNG